VAEEKDPTEERAADVRVHVTTGHRTVGDALYAVAETAKRAAPEAIPIVRQAWRVLLGLTAVVVALGVVLVGGILLYEHSERQEREATEAREAAEKAASERAEEARAVQQRRAVLDLLEPGLVPMLCPVPGEVIGRQLVMAQPADARERMQPCLPMFGQDCSKANSHGCTPATATESAAWDRVFSSAPAATRLSAARRAVVGADPDPRVTFLDPGTGQLYTASRAELEIALRQNPSFVPATPLQIAAWDGAVK
jgi:hypothetical protein